MKLSDFPKEPVIIGGCGRSGTTLLLAILGSHPNMFAIPFETQVLCPHAYDYVSDPSLATEAHATMSREQLFKLQMQHHDPSYPIDPSQIERFLTEAKPSHSRWVEKTPKNVLFFKRLLDVFDQKVKLIHMVRDGRDVVTSIHPGRSQYHIPVERWVTEVSAGLELKDHSCVYTLKYEDLVLRYDETIQALLRFVGEPMHENLQVWTLHTHVKSHDSFHGEEAKPIYFNAIGRWKDDRHRQRITEFMQNERALNHLKALGYD